MSGPYKPPSGARIYAAGIALGVVLGILLCVVFLVVVGEL